MSIKSVLQNLYAKGVLPLSWLEEPFSFSANKKDLVKLKGKFKGERCFIIGNGPSLNDNNLNFLKGEYTFGVNSIFYKTQDMGFKPTFYVVEDGHVVDDNLEEINNFRAEYKFFPSAYKGKIKQDENTLYFNMNRGFYEEYSPNHEMPRFSRDASQVLYCGQSVTIINLQLAFYLGFTEVYLIGMDFNYVIPDTATVDGNTIISNEDDCNHFDGRYFGKGKKWHDPMLENVLASYKLCDAVYTRHGRKVFNATFGGKLEVFERVDYDSLF